MAEALWVNIDLKSTLLKRVGQFRPNFHVMGRSPANHFCTDRQTSKCLTTVLLTTSTQRNFVADFLQAKCNFTWKTAVLHFWAPLGSFVARYDVRLRHIGKRIVDLLLNFFASCYSWGATSEYWLKIGATTGSVWPKISGTRGRPHQSFFLSEN